MVTSVTFSSCSVVESEILPCLQQLNKDDDVDVKYFSEESLVQVNSQLESAK